MDTQERISTDFQMTVCVRQRNVRADVNFSLGQGYFASAHVFEE